MRGQEQALHINTCALCIHPHITPVRSPNIQLAEDSHITERFAELCVISDMQVSFIA